MKLRAVRSVLIVTLIITTCEVLVAATTNTVQMGNFNFTPRNLNITSGDSVIWVNNSGISHDSTSSNAVWATGLIGSPGSSTPVRFSNPGIFPYHCQFHQITAPGQNGTINVAAAPNALPTVTITNPANNATFTAPATFSVQASATDSDGTVSQVEFFRGVTSLGIDNSNPYSANANNVAAGTYTILAVATDNNGGKATNSITVTVTNPPMPVTLANTVANGNDFTFSFLSETGRTYTVEFRPELDAGSWELLTSFTANTTNSIVIDTNTNAQRFYRVGAQ